MEDVDGAAGAACGRLSLELFPGLLAQRNVACVQPIQQNFESGHQLCLTRASACNRTEVERVLQQNVAEENKVQNNEVLIPGYWPACFRVQFDTEKASSCMFILARVTHACTNTMNVHNNTDMPPPPPTFLNKAHLTMQMTFHFLSNINYVWTPSNQTSRHFFFQSNRPATAMFSVLCCCVLCSISSLCCLF